jgi:hypothetical protein
MLSALATSLLRLDSLSCLLTVISTLLVGRKLWQGWVVAALNSVIISIIGMRTAQFGFIPANLVCIVLYAHNLWSWRRVRSPERHIRLTSAQEAAMFSFPPQAEPQRLPKSARGINNLRLTRRIDALRWRKVETSASRSFVLLCRVRHVFMHRR